METLKMHLKKRIEKAKKSKEKNWAGYKKNNFEIAKDMAHQYHAEEKAYREALQLVELEDN